MESLAQMCEIRPTTDFMRRIIATQNHDDTVHLAQSVNLVRAVGILVHVTTQAAPPREIALAMWVRLANAYPTFDEVQLALNVGLNYLTREAPVEVHKLVAPLLDIPHLLPELGELKNALRRQPMAMLTWMWPGQSSLLVLANPKTGLCGPFVKWFSAWLAEKTCLHALSAGLDRYTNSYGISIS